MSILRSCLAASTALACASSLCGQPTWSLITSPDEIIVLAGGAAPKALGFIDDQESVIVTPSFTTSYAARPFWTLTTLNVMHGDGDNDGDLPDTSRIGDLNCQFVRQRPPHAVSGPVDPSDVFISHDFTSTTFVATNTGIQRVVDGDVYRARNGTIEFFVTEAQLQTAFGGGDFDVDALAQDSQGNLYLSFLTTVTINGTIYNDGAILHIPAAAITYDAAGLVSVIAANSAQIIADETDVGTMVSNAGAMNMTGSLITSISDVSGLEIDPAGGTWVSPFGQTFPNLLFCSNTDVNLDNIWSTNAGGQLAVINGVQMGYQTGPATGSVLGIGLLPSNQDAISGLALVPEQHHWIAIDSPQSGRQVLGVFDIEVGRCQPGSAVGLLLSIWNNEMPGGWINGFPSPRTVFGGNALIELDLATLFALPGMVADAQGYASLTLPAPATISPGPDLLLQGVGLPFNTGFPGSVGFALTATSNITF